MLYYTQLRYRLMPYIYSLAGKSYFDDYTIMRGLAMDFGQDKNVLSIGDQYMFGGALMVCPVYEYKARSREIYFPAGSGWYNLSDGKFTTGGQKQNVSAPFNQMPVYVAAGSVLPTGALIQNTKQEQKDLTIYVYAGKNGNFTLYEDENVNYNYEKGKFSKIGFTYNDKNKTLEIANREGSFDGMSQTRKFTVILIDPANPQGIDSPIKNQKTVEYTGKNILLNL
jgi:alpha-D-xyloside xylohydrolase